MGLASDASIRIFPSLSLGRPKRPGLLYEKPGLARERRPGPSQPDQVLIPVTEAAFHTATGPNSTRDRIGRSWNISLEKRVY